MFIGERIDAEVAEALYLDGLNVSKAAAKLGVRRETIRAARTRIERNMKVLGLDKMSHDERISAIRRLIQNAADQISVKV